MSRKSLSDWRRWFVAALIALLVACAILCVVFMRQDEVVIREAHPRTAQHESIVQGPVARELPPLKPAEIPPPSESPAVEPAGAGTVQGVVYWAADGRLAQDAEVLAFREPPAGAEPSASSDALTGARTGADGTFCLTSLPFAMILLEARHGTARGYSNSLLSDFMPVDNRNILLYETGAIAGTVVNNTDAPVSGAQLRAVAWDDGKTAHDYANPEGIVAQTNDEGAFRFEQLAMKAWRFKVDAPGYGSVRTELWAVGGEGYRVVLPQARLLRGIAKFRADGKAAAGLPIVATPVSKEAIGDQTRTDGEGRFVFDTIVTGTYSLRCVDKRYYAEACQVVVEPDKPPPEVTLWLGPGGIIEGRVYDMVRGNGKAGVTVIAAAPGGKPFFGGAGTCTGVDGRYRVAGLAPATYNISLAGRGGIVGRISRIPPVVLRAGARMQLDIPVDCGVSISGTVIDTEGHPVADARVSADPMNSLRTEALSGADGSFTISGLLVANPVQLSATKVAYATAPMEPILVPPEGIDGLRLVLVKQDAALTGQVVDGHGQPLRAQVDVYSEAVGERARGQNTKTDAEGRFVFPALSAGSYGLRVWVEYRGGHYHRVLGNVQLRPGERRENVILTFDLGEGLSIRGRVLDQDGKPVAGAEAMTSLPKGEGVMEMVTSATDAQGNYELAGLPQGEYQVGVNHRTLYAEESYANVPAGSEGVDFVLYPKPRVAGRVLDSKTGNPIQGCRLRDQTREQAVSGAQGDFEWYLARPGLLDIAAEMPGYASHTQRLDLMDGQSAEDLVIRLEPGGVILEGEVMDQAGNPVAGAQIREGIYDVFHPSFMAGAGGLAVSDGEGRFSIETGADRLVTVSALHPNYAPAAGIIEDASEGVRRVQLIMTSSSAVEGHVRLDGRPLEGAVVELYDENSSIDTSAVTDQTGYYQRIGIPEGRYRVELDLSELGISVAPLTGAQAVVETRGNETVRHDLDLQSARERTE